MTSTIAAHASAARRAVSPSVAKPSLERPGGVSASGTSPVNHWWPEPMVTADHELLEWLPAPVVPTEFAAQQLCAEEVLMQKPGTAAPEL